MGSMFFNLGRSVGAGLRKGKWLWQSLAGSEEDAIRAEHEAGRDMANQFAAEAPVVREPALTELLAATGGRLTRCVKNKLRTFAFTALSLPEPNAFALPGGFIFITTGLLELCGVLRTQPAEGAARKGAAREAAAPAEPRAAEPRAVTDLQANGASPDHRLLIIPADVPTAAIEELAFILGHEMGHVMRGHAMDRMTNTSLVNAATRVIPIGGTIGRLIVRTGVKFAHSAYSQDQEFEADEVGTRLIAAAGIDPLAAVRLLDRLSQAHGSVAQGLGDYFSTHPPFDQRIARLKKLIK